MFSCIRLFGVLPTALLVTAWLPAMAQSLPTGTAFTPGVSHDKRHITYTVERDGTYVKDIQLTRRIENEGGVRTEGQQTVPYSASLQTVEIVQARVITPQGASIDVPPSAIFDQQPTLSQGAPAFSDIVAKAIVFPQIRPGSRTVVHVRIAQKKPVLPGHFSAIEFSSPHDVRHDVTYTVIAPADMPMQVVGVDLPIEKTVLADGRIQWRARTSNAVAVPPEPGSVATIDYSQRFVASSLPSGPALAHAYRNLAGELGKPTPTVTALAQSLTQGIDDPREQTRVLYDWVRTQIRYVAIVLGRGGWQPHGVDSIVAAGYGDCKDKATLLSALLEAKGIASTPVLVNSSNSFWMPEIPTMQSFNHMITFIPSLGLYVDATDRWASFGVLPAQDTNKRVLHLMDGVWATTPGPESTTVLRHRVSTTAEGRVSGQVALSGTGLSEASLRRSAAGMHAVPDNTLLVPLLEKMQVRGEGRLHRAAPGATQPPASIVFDYSGVGSVDLPGPGATRLPAAPFAPVEGPLSLLQTPRKFPFPCPSFNMQEEVELDWPATLRITRNFPPLEQSADSEGARWRYVARTAQDGTRTVVTRSLVAEQLKTVCTAADLARWQPLIEAVQRNLRAQMLYEPAL